MQTEYRLVNTSHLSFPVTEERFRATLDELQKSETPMCSTFLNDDTMVITLEYTATIGRFGTVRHERRYTS